MTEPSHRPEKPTELEIGYAAGKPPLLHCPELGTVADAVDWLQEHREELRAQLLRSGCLMLRGLPARDAAGFAALRDVLLQKRAAYKEKATPRSDFGDDIYSSTDLPPAQPIMLHNENSYTLDFPGTLVFFCVQAPEEGGATTVGDMREALRLVPAPLRERFAAQGWMLERSYSSFAGMPWEKAFGTADRSQVEEYCQYHRIGWNWLVEDGLRTAQRRPAIIAHPATGERVWFNHAAFWNSWSLDEDVREVLQEAGGAAGLPFETRFGDGGEITEAEAAALRRAYEAVTVRESWQPGDLLLVDNILCAHGRDAFKGDRKILVAMGEPVRLLDCSPSVSPSAVGIHG
ncbi:TauD/TfdA family dioxygenase [Streptomyces sp. NBC_01217]|uniref:TauD/TfdA family dioxygenase n=1 Tax=Streptomyces sp. NBC_01217 TaxID=2903779 RepID=UPI002E104820|nr:TauD/TfdA family dioxygenase [Streptomyces sp. NBC_01217]